MTPADESRRARAWARRLPLLAGGLAAALAVALALAGAEPAARRHVVEIRGFAFVPAHLRISAGDTVVWINRDVVPHTATVEGRGWDSGVLAAGAGWSVVPEGTGETAYVCALHPAMKGTIAVEQ